MEEQFDWDSIQADVEDPVISDLTSEFVHGLLEFWFGDLHDLDEISEDKYAMYGQLGSITAIAIPLARFLFLNIAQLVFQHRKHGCSSCRKVKCICHTSPP